MKSLIKQNKTHKNNKKTKDTFLIIYWLILLSSELPPPHPASLQMELN